MRPHAFHLGHAGGFELVPHRAGAVRAAIERIVVGRDAGDRAEQNRIVAIHHGLDADRRLLLQAAGVIAGPFAERAFVDLVVRMDEALERDLGMRRDRQAGLRPHDHLHRLAQQPAGGVVLVLAVRNFQARDHEQRRVHAAHHRDRARLAALVILLLDHVAVLALGAHHGGELLAVRLHAIGAVVDPAGVGIAHDHHVAGADVVAAVVLVPARHRNLEQVDVVAGLDVLQKRAARHLDRRDGLRLLHVFAPMPHQLDLGAVGRIAHRHVDAADRGQQVGQDAMALGIAGDVVEQHQRVADLALVDVDDAADLALALGAADVRHLAGGLHHARARRADPASARWMWPRALRGSTLVFMASSAGSSGQYSRADIWESDNLAVASRTQSAVAFADCAHTLYGGSRCEAQSRFYF